MIAFHPLEVKSRTGVRNLEYNYSKIYSVAVISGRGRCGNKLQAKRCRERALDAMLKCGKEIWNKRWTPAPTNAKCAANLDSSREPNAMIKRWHGGAGRCEAQP